MDSRKNNSKAQDAQVNIRFTVDQKEALERLADHLGKSVAEMLRDLALIELGKNLVARS